MYKIIWIEVNEYNNFPKVLCLAYTKINKWLGKLLLKF